MINRKLPKLNRAVVNFFLINTRFSYWVFRIRNGILRRVLFFRSFLNATTNLEVTYPKMEWSYYYKTAVLPRLGLSIFPKNSYVLLISGSYGDIFSSLALLKNFYEKYNSKINVLLPIRWKLLAERFSYSYVDYYFLKHDDLYRYSSLISSPSSALVKGYVYPLLPTVHPFLGELALTQRVSDYEIRRCLLGLPVGAQMHLPECSDTRREMAQKIILKAGCRIGKTLIVSFSSNSNPELTEAIQSQIIEMLINNSELDIILNTSKTYPWSKEILNVHKNINTIDLPCDIPIEVIEYAGYYLGVCNGLSVILATFPCNAKVAVLVDITEKYSSNNGIKIDPASIAISNNFLKDLCNYNNFQEFYFDKNNLSEKLVDVIDWYKN